MKIPDKVRYGKRPTLRQIILLFLKPPATLPLPHTAVRQKPDIDRYPFTGHHSSLLSDLFFLLYSGYEYLFLVPQCGNFFSLLSGLMGRPTPVFLPREFHRQRSLVGCCPWSLTESDTTATT